MKKAIKKILVTGASLLMSASVNMGINSIKVNASNVNSRITNQINHMSWRQKIGQMFVGDGIPNNNRRADYLVHHYNLGGIILESSNMNGNVRNHTNSMGKATHHSLLIGTDQEGWRSFSLRL